MGRDLPLLMSPYKICWCQVDLSLLLPSRSVSVKPSSSSRCVMWEPPFFGGFQGLWEGWDGFIVPRFPSDRHFHRGARTRFLGEVWPVDRPWVLLVAILLAVRHHLDCLLNVLLRLHDLQRVTQ